MLVKHPWLTLVVVFALGIGIPASLAPHHLIDAILDESPPFDQGDQVVGVVGTQPGVGHAGAVAPRRLRVAANAPHLVRVRRGRTVPGGERDLGRRPCGGRAGGGDERVLVRVDASAARAGTCDPPDGGATGRRVVGGAGSASSVPSRPALARAAFERRVGATADRRCCSAAAGRGRRTAASPAPAASRCSNRVRPRVLGRQTARASCSVDAATSTRRTQRVAKRPPKGHSCADRMVTAAFPGPGAGPSRCGHRRRLAGPGASASMVRL